MQSIPVTEEAGYASASDSVSSAPTSPEMSPIHDQHALAMPETTRSASASSTDSTMTVLSLPEAIAPPAAHLHMQTAVAQIAAAAAAKPRPKGVKRARAGADDDDDYSVSAHSESSDSSNPPTPKPTRKGRTSWVTAAELSGDSDEEVPKARRGRRASRADDKMTKRERNKISAMKYRKRRKMQMENLEYKVSQLNDVIGTQTKKITSLNTENKMLKEQLEFLRGLVGMKLPSSVPGISVKEEPESTAAHAQSFAPASAGALGSFSMPTLPPLSPTAGLSLPFLASPTATPHSSHSRLPLPMPPIPQAAATSSPFVTGFRPLVMVAMLVCLLFCLFSPAAETAPGPASRRLLSMPEDSHSVFGSLSTPFVFLLGFFVSSLASVASAVFRPRARSFEL